MNEDIRKDILAILKDSLNAVTHQNFSDLKEISNHINHNSSIFQDKDSISIAVLIHSLSKVMPNCEYVVKDKVREKLEACIEFLTNNKISAYRNTVKAIFEDVKILNEKLKKYFEEVIEYSEIKKASKLYYNGLSIGRAAEILGINRWELMDYVGKTKINEEAIAGISVDDRLNYLRDVFRE